MEQWKEFRQDYSVSNFGRIRNDKTGTFRKLQDRDKRKLGYLSSYIIDKNYNVHRLVAIHFVENPRPEEFDTVNHIDNNPSNNHWTNLEWCTQKLNMEHCKKQGRHTADNCESFKLQQNETNTPSKVKRKKNGNLPIGVFAIKAKNGIRYHARFVNTTVGYIGLGSYDTVYEAFQAVKAEYFKHYGVYPDCPEPEYEESEPIKNGKLKLTEEQAKYVKYSSRSCKELADELNVSRQCISSVRFGWTWKHL